MATQEYIHDNNSGSGEWEATKPRTSIDAKESMKVDVEAKGDDVEVPFRFFSFHRLQAMGALASLIAISLLPLFTVGGSLGIIFLSLQLLISASSVVDLGGADIDTWLVMVHGIAMASMAPFAGSLSDLFGRKYMALAGTLA